MGENSINGKTGQELTLLDQQSLGMEILRDVHCFCKKKSIRYSVAYGTLIGVIRHHGFIPWDDDVDIIMPRPDYIRFCREYESDSFNLICREKDSTCMIAFARVYDDTRTVCISKIPWTEKQVGFWIDIFPVDAVSDVYSEYNSAYFAQKTLWKRTILGRQAKASFSCYRYSLLPTLKLLVKKILERGGKNVCKQISLLIERAQLHNWGDTCHWAQMACLDGKPEKEYSPMSAFENCIEMDFHDVKVMVMAGYDDVLTRLYGDYLLPPPIQSQIPHNNIFNKWYWK